MAIKEFELFHGGVIARLLRAEKPVTLRLVETRPKENWSTYTLNDSIDLVISHSKTPRQVVQEGGGISWTFGFGKNQLNQIASLKRSVYIALVCGERKIGNDNMHICLLNPEMVQDLIDTKQEQQSITVRKPKHKGKFRVFKEKAKRHLVAQNAIDKFEVPA